MRKSIEYCKSVTLAQSPTIELCKRATNTRVEPKDPQDVEELSPEGQRCDTDCFKAPRRRSMGRRTKSQSSDLAGQSPENGKSTEPGASGLTVQSPDNDFKPIASGLPAQIPENAMDEPPSVV
jgi:hypothetical protein